MEIPVTVKNKKFYLKTEILEGDIPWLIGQKTLSNMGMMLNLGKNTVSIGVLGGMEIKLRVDKRDHLRFPFREEKWKSYG